jgi:hypothetical protein
MAYYIFGNTARQHVCKTGAAVGGHGNHIGIDGFGKVDNSIFFGNIVKHINGVIFQSEFFSKLFHVVFHYIVALKIARCINTHQVYG